MDERLVTQLCNASVNKSLIPEKTVEWELEIAPDAFMLPESLASIYALDEYRVLDRAGRAVLLRHETACLLSYAIRLETVLMYRFAELIRGGDVLERRVPYFLHELEEEARHSRMFARTIACLGTGAYRMDGILGVIEKRLAVLTRSPVFFFLLTLAAEEIPDVLFQKIMADESVHPIMRQISRIHRIEEARHIRFNREAFIEVYRRSGRLERAALGALAPPIVAAIFDASIRPSVYVRTGLTHSQLGAWRLWFAARDSEHRRTLRLECAQRLVGFLNDAGIVDASNRRRWVSCGLMAG